MPWQQVVLSGPEEAREAVDVAILRGEVSGDDGLHVQGHVVAVGRLSRLTGRIVAAHRVLLHRLPGSTRTFCAHN